MTQRVFVDANIFASRTIMDWLMHLRRQNEGMFQLHATEDVFVEALHATRKSVTENPDDPSTYSANRRVELRYGD